jgi:putative cardiolipin synthase
MRALRDAANRGVRVRLLLDDLYTTGEDEVLLALAHTPNIEVRLFNPFPGARASGVGRFLASGLEISRVDRRMHNKLFVADNCVAVAGGRNMADEYVNNAAGSNFVDMDAFVAGPVVHDLSAEFDHYWNSTTVFPLQSIASSTRSPDELRAQFEKRSSQTLPPVATEVSIDGKVLNWRSDIDESFPQEVPIFMVPMLNLPFELERNQLSPLLWAKARVLYDPLSKTAGHNEKENTLKGTVTGAVSQWFATAKEHVKMVSPYFVPSDAAIHAMTTGLKHGIGVTIVTNSLASTDESWVYIGYMHYLKRLLEAGADVYELSPSLSVKRRAVGLFGKKTTGALHMKNAIVDRKAVFIGSMNLDQRSAILNTEMGLIIDSPEMARQLERFSSSSTNSGYRVRLSADGKDIEWHETGDQGEIIIHHEPPETSAWLRLKLRLIGPFIPEKEL